MRNLVSVICAFFTIGCVVAITGCGGGGGNGIKGGDPPAKSVTLHGNVTIERDGTIVNPVVVMYSLSTNKVMFQTTVAGTKGVHPYKLVIPAGQPVDKYQIALYDWQGGGSIIDGSNEKNVHMGGYRYPILHLNAVQVNGESPVDIWCAVNDASALGPKPWEWSSLQITQRDVTNASLDFSAF